MERRWYEQTSSRTARFPIDPSSLRAAPNRPSVRAPSATPALSPVPGSVPVVDEAQPPKAPSESEFRFRLDESLTQGIGRIARHETTAAALFVETLSVDPDRSVHEIRKHCKRLRGMARLVRDVVGPAEYHRVNRGLRDMARMFADARDSRVRLDTLDALRADHELPPDFAPELDAVRLGLSEDHARQTEMLANSPLVRESALIALAQASRRFQGWEVPQDASSLGGGLTRMYTRGARRRAEAGTTDRAEVYHDWRKRAKYLRYGLELLGPAWPSVLGAHEDELHALTDLLGDANDATQLASVPHFSGAALTGPSEGMRGLIHAYRSDHWTQALGLGSRLYAERPRDFTARICAYCDAWWRDGGAPDPAEARPS